MCVCVSVGGCVGRGRVWDCVKGVERYVGKGVVDRCGRAEWVQKKVWREYGFGWRA